MSWQGSKVSPLVRAYAAERGWHIKSLWQPPWLFPDDGRRLKRVAVPSDPWWVQLSDDPEPISMGRIAYGQGATPDDAVLAAIPRGVTESLRLCEIAVDNLRGCLVEVTSRGKRKDRFDETS